MKNLCVMMALVMLVAAPLSLWSAEDGAALFKSKCSACHGEKGEGKPAVKMPAVKGTAMTVDEMVVYLTRGDKNTKMHANPISGVNEEQAKAIAEHVKSLE